MSSRSLTISLILAIAPSMQSLAPLRLILSPATLFLWKLTTTPPNSSPILLKTFPNNKVFVVFRIHSHQILYNILELFHTSLYDSFGSCNYLLDTNNGDAFPISIVSSWEDYSCSSCRSGTCDAETSLSPPLCHLDAPN